MNRRGFFGVLAVGLIQFLRDLALLPSIWRNLVSAERRERFRRSPEGIEQERREIADLCESLVEDRLSDARSHPGQPRGAAPPTVPA